MYRPKIGFSIGDINGIGLEVILKSITEPRIAARITPVIFGSGKVVAYHKNIITKNDLNFVNLRPDEPYTHDKINVVNVWQDSVQINLGEINETGGKYAHLSLDAAFNALKNKQIDALVTAPIHKKAMELAQFGFPGHTEYIAHAFSNHTPIMILAHEGLRVGLVTGHVALSDVSTVLTKELIIKKAKSFIESLHIDFGIEKPKLAILGLNPHASDNGLFGNEEAELIKPAIETLKNLGHIVLGPFAADGFFGSASWQKTDGVLAMYHDQGLIPFKALSFGSGVNFTAGLPVIRTSPDHGTGFEIAGKNEANAGSMRHAIFAAIDIVRNRNEYQYYQSNKLKKNQLTEEPIEGDE
jgi:4-hydroxythreonine-4-phosphate dehydrogenase